MPSNKKPQLIGVLLAAGRGRRMNGAKQFEPWPSPSGKTKPLVAASFDAINIVCDKMIVVLGHRAEEVAVLLGERSFMNVESDPDAPMFASICTGLRAAHDLDATATVLLHPGDHPEVAPATLNGLIDVSRNNPDLAVLPEYQGRGGHPVLIPPSIAQRILAADCPGGLREFWRDHPELCKRIKVDDPSSTRDVDYCL